MNKKIILSFIIVTFIALISYNLGFEHIYGYPKDFNFSLRYGVLGKNKIDTFDNTFTKDTVEGEKTVDLKLTHSEMKEIYNAFKHIDIEKIPSRFKKRRDMEPKAIYVFKVFFDESEKNISYTSDSFILPKILLDTDEVKIEENKIEKSDNYKKLEGINRVKNLIIRIIDSKEKVKNLPQSTMYL